MNHGNRSSADDPTAGRTSDQPAPSAGGLSSGRSGLDWSSDVVNREPFDTPRRYDQPIEDDDDPVMPAPDSTLNTKI